MKTKFFTLTVLTLLLSAVTLTFQSCDSDDNDVADPEISPFAGTWSGTYAGDDSGTWIIIISDSGDFVSGSSFSNNAQESFATKSATFNADGSSTSESENGTIGTSQVTGTKLTGTWVNPLFNNASGVPLNGTLTGNKE